MDSKALFKIQCGLFVAAVGTAEKLNGCITNTLMEQSHVPVKFSVTINKSSLTHKMICDKKTLGVSVLSTSADTDLVKRFGFVSGRDVNKFDGISDYKLDMNGNPVLSGEKIAATFSLEVYDAVDVGTHTIFLCTATDMQDADGDSITYSGYRASIKR